MSILESFTDESIEEFLNSQSLLLDGWSRREIPASWASYLLGEWFGRARLSQYPLLLGEPATTMMIGGRGAGKTRVGAEWVLGIKRGLSPFTLSGVEHGRIALVGETLGDVREVMIEGPSGIMTIARIDRPRYEAGRRRLLWDNGAVALAFSSEDPESLRGPQFDAAWCDELAKWRYPEAVFDMLQFGLRLGTRPRQLITTTPRPIALMRRLLADQKVVVTRMATRENATNLAPGFLAAVEERYAGTHLGRQELDGEMVEDRVDALWSRAMLEAAFLREMPELRRIVVAVDPPATSRKSSDACGIVAAGLDGEDRAIVLADATMRAAKPAEWAAVAVGLYHRLAADCIVAEVNQGGDMVSAVIRAADGAVPVRARHARRSKWTRAEPVAMLYQQGRVRHAGRFAALEDEMCDLSPSGLSNGRSPDRVDALVWAIGELIGEGRLTPRIREIR